MPSITASNVTSNVFLLDNSNAESTNSANIATTSLAIFKWKSDQKLFAIISYFSWKWNRNKTNRFHFYDNNTRNNDDNNYDNIQVYHGNGAFNIRFTPAFHFRLYFGTMEKRPKNCIVDRVSMALEISCHTSQHKQFASGEDKSWFSLWIPKQIKYNLWL